MGRAFSSAIGKVSRGISLSGGVALRQSVCTLGFVSNACQLDLITNRYRSEDLIYSLMKLALAMHLFKTDVDVGPATTISEVRNDTHYAHPDTCSSSLGKLWESWQKKYL